MQYSGTIRRVNREGDDIILIVDTDYGPRGIEIDQDLWRTILSDAELSMGESIIGWRLTYDPDTGELDVFQPMSGDDGEIDEAT